MRPGSQSALLCALCALQCFAAGFQATCPANQTCRRLESSSSKLQVANSETPRRLLAAQSRPRGLEALMRIEQGKLPEVLYTSRRFLQRIVALMHENMRHHAKQFHFK